MPVSMPVSMPISTLKGTWRRLLSDERLRRSSQVLSVIDQQVCIFGGEVKPREPIDDKVDTFSLSGTLPLNFADHQGTTLTAPQMQRIWKQSQSLQHQVQELEAPQLYSMARCTYSPDEAAPTWLR
jgi:hypothetical protein